MTTITEDYVSFETAKLLKEKGFDEYCWSWYEDEDYIVESNDDYGYQSNTDHISRDFICSRPTLQMAMKWLREVHSLHIWIGHAAGKVLSWYYEIHGISDEKVKHIGGMQCGSYEVACEAAIKYCLENLI